MSYPIPRPDGPRDPVPMIRAKVPFTDEEIVQAVLDVVDPDQDPTDHAAYFALWYPLAGSRSIFEEYRFQKRMPQPVAARDPFVLHYALHKFRHDWEAERAAVTRKLDREEHDLTGVNNRLAKYEMRLDHRPGLVDPAMADLRNDRRTELRRLREKIMSLLKEIDAERKLIREYYDPLFAMADEVLFELRVRDSATVLNRAQSAADAVQSQLADTEMQRAKIVADAASAKAKLDQLSARYADLQREAAEIKLQVGSLS
ncbi:MAG: hypothetical protein KF812_10875 [Fimbriimonadaceae bacterium]|nr:hypothetical protein [Fimbriimonadaceae bacterium]